MSFITASRVALFLVASTLLLPVGGRAQVDPVSLTFGQAIELKTVEMSSGPDGEPVFTPIEVRLATLEELRKIALDDSEDHDGIPGIRDACPLRADCGRADGSFAELRGPDAKSDLLTPVLIRFQNAEELGDLILAQNAAQSTPFYPADELITIAVAAGFPSTTTARWTSEYLCGKAAKRRCQDDCHRKCPVPTPAGGKTEGRGHCLGDCLAACAKVKQCPSAGTGGGP